jgi:predicted MPP superfamily phosphohydrolase
VSRRGIAIAALVPLGLAIWGFGIEPATLRVVERRVALPGWPAGTPLRVALLADLHVGSPWNGPEHLREIVRRTNETRPGLVLMLGDYICTGTIGGDFVTPEVIEGIVRDLHAPLGVYAVLGNHDLGLNGRRITRALERAGITVLSDRAVRIEPADGLPVPLWLAGVSDYLRGDHDVRGTLAQVTDDAPVILFTHNPDVFPEVPASVALSVAAHTHGGQVYIPLIGRPIVPSVHGQRYAAGLVVEEGKRMFVATGIGTSYLGVRFLVPPEITVLVIEPAPAA